VGTGILYVMINLLGRGADLLPPSGAEVEAEWSCNSACHVCLLAWQGLLSLYQHLWIVKAHSLVDTNTHFLCIMSQFIPFRTSVLCFSILHFNNVLPFKPVSHSVTLYNL